MEGRAPALLEPAVGYHPYGIGVLTLGRDPVWGQCQAGSLTGAVASQRVTEAPKGTLGADGNRALECKGKRVLDSETYKSSWCESRA